jgi:hypothetical protein
VLVVLYYLLPLDRPWSADTAVRLLAGLLVFAGITAWQVRAIAGSRYPALRAGEALGLIAPLYLLLFASTYFVMERASAANFTQPLTRTGALYFTGSEMSPKLSPPAAQRSMMIDSRRESAGQPGGGCEIRTREGLPPTRFPTMLASVHRRPPPSANCANTIRMTAGERCRTGMNETKTEPRPGPRGWAQVWRPSRWTE